MKIVIFIFMISGLFAQTKPLAFEVATVRPSDPSRPAQGDPGLHVNRNIVRMNSSPLRVIIAAAYQVKPYQVIGPDWLASDRFEINATLPDGATLSQVPEMLRALLDERFGLKVQKAQKQSGAYVLEKGRTPFTLEATELDPEDSDLRNSAGPGSGMISLGRGAGFSLASNRFVARKVTMEQVAESLTLYLDQPVVNRTDIEGHYDVSLPATPDDIRAMALRARQKQGIPLTGEMLRFLDTASSGSLFDSLENFGLKMSSRKEMIDFVDVVEVRRNPTEN